MPDASRQWRFVVTDLRGHTITLLDHLATNRTVTPLLGEPLIVTGEVPSDNPEINIMHTDGFPFLAEGVRQLYCFREESETVPYFTIRASTLIRQINDAAAQDVARTRFTAWDPWDYMMGKPVLVSANTTTDAAGDPLPVGVNPGDLIPDVGISYPDTMTADEIAIDMVTNTATFSSASAPLPSRQMFIDYGQFGADSTNIQQTCQTFNPPGYPIQQGAMLGQALKDLMATGVLDILMTPIYDVLNRAGILCAFDIYDQRLFANNALGAGIYNYAAQFAWDKPGASLVGVDNMYDGTGRANHIQFYSGPGGPPVLPQEDEASYVLYGESWAQQFFPATQDNLPAAEALAIQQLYLRARYRQTLTVNPAPERAPEPFLDYNLGDAVPDLVSDRMRQPLPPTVVADSNAVDSSTVTVLEGETSQFLPFNGQIVIGGHYVDYGFTTATTFEFCGSHPATVAGELISKAAWSRVFGIPIEIDDNGVETVRQLLFGPTGAPT